jgi:hypothetical protein
MKILFVDHSYHKITTSSQFLVDLLRQFFEVEVFFADPDKPHDIALLKGKTGYDAVLLWQMDFLAPFFLAQGLPTIVVPMYDGSGSMPDLHWLWARKAKFINFSRRLHERIKGLGGPSLLVRYYPKPHEQAVPLGWHDDVRVFLWQRRPEHGINLQAVERLFGDNLAAVHVHNATDDPNIDASTYLGIEPKPYRLTTSSWFPSRADYEKVLSDCNFFIAPRRSEGIGMGFLEAMARGMIVCGHDDATHDEYISNGLNGILFNADLPQHVDVQDSSFRQRLSAMALKAVGDGHKKWLETTLKIVDYVKRIPSSLSDVPELASEEFLKGLVEAYYAGIPTYQAFLARNMKLGSKLSGIELEDVLDENLTYDASLKRKKQKNALNAASDRMPWLHHNSLRPHEIADGAIILAGGVRLREDTAWIEGEKLVLGFRVDVRTSAVRRLKINLMRSTQESVRYCIILNDVLLEASILSDDGTLDLLIPEKAVSIDNELHLQFQSNNTVTGENVGIVSFVFE